MVLSREKLIWPLNGCLGKGDIISSVILMNIFERFSLAKQLRFGIVLMVGLSVLVTGSVLIVLSFRSRIDLLHDLQRERSRAAAEKIDAYIDDLQRKLGYLARVRGLSELSPDIQRNFLDALVRHNTAYEIVAIVNKYGHIVSEAAPYGNSFQKDLSRSAAFIRAFQEHEDFFGSVEFDAVVKLPLVTMAVPIRNNEDIVDGALMTKVNLEFLWFVVSKTEVGARGYAYIVDDRRFLITQKGDSPASPILTDMSEYPYIQELTLATTPPLMTYQGLHGETVLGSASLIESVFWRVVVELPVDEAYAPLKRMLLVMVGALFFTALAAIGLSVFFSGQFVRPLKKLTSAAEQIQADNLNVSVTITGRHELGMLAATFNTMTTRLRELIGGLERKVTELKQAEQELKKLTEELQRSNQELEQFAYVASHDLQEPLRMVASYTKLLEKRYKEQLDEKADTYIHYAVDGATRMQDLINDLLAYSRVNTRTEQARSVESQEILNNVLTNLKVTIQESGALVTHDELPEVSVDAAQFARVFQNLIGNAIKFRGETPPRIHVSAQSTGDEWLFSVQDNGIGIDPKHQERIFTIFQRLYARNEYPGTGIGLAICKRIINRHGGKIRVESEPGKGAVFYFTLAKVT